MTGAPDGRTVEAVARQARDLAEGLFAMVWPRNADEILAGRNFATGALADMLLPHLLASRALAAERIKPGDPRPSGMDSGDGGP
jgi:hypothetical protein